MSSSRTLSRAPLARATVTSVASSVLTVQTGGTGFTDITREIAAFVAEAQAKDGGVTVFVRHTSASLTIH